MKFHSLALDQTQETREWTLARGDFRPCSRLPQLWPAVPSTAGGWGLGQTRHGSRWSLDSWCRQRELEDGETGIYMHSFIRHTCNRLLLTSMSCTLIILCVTKLLYSSFVHSLYANVAEHTHGKAKLVNLFFHPLKLWKLTVDSNSQTTQMVEFSVLFGTTCIYR